MTPTLIMGDDDDDDSSYPTWRPLKVTLKGGQPWGFTLSGGAEVNQPLTIIKIDEAGKAGRNGCLREGDRLLGVNDVFCRNSHAEALRLIESAFRTLTLTLWRTADPENYAGSSPHLHQQSQLERRESSSRLQAAKHLILRSLRPGHSGWAEVSGSGASNNSSSTSGSASGSNSGAGSSNTNGAPALDRNNQIYHSEGKGLKSKRKAWASERELRSTGLSAAPSSGVSSGTATSSAAADRSQSFSDRNGARRRLSLNEDDPAAGATSVSPEGAMDPRNETPEEEALYENLSPPSTISTLPSRKDAKERRSFRKLTKDSGYETNYSDYANLDSLGRPGGQSAGETAGADAVDLNAVVYEAPAEMTPRSRSPVSNRSSSPRYPHQKLHRAAATPSSSSLASTIGRRGGSQTRACEGGSPYGDSTVGGASLSVPAAATAALARYPSSDSVHSHSSAATLTAGSVHSAKSSPSLCLEPGVASPVKEHDQWDCVPPEEDYIEMVAKKDSPSSSTDETAESRCLNGKLGQRSGLYWENEEEASYASNLRSSSYLVINSKNNRHQAGGRPPAPLPTSPHHQMASMQQQLLDSYPVSSSCSSSSSSSHYWSTSQSTGLTSAVDDFEPSDPGMSIMTSGIYYPPPSPPPAPERDPASLKDINYGPGHEKFPSWPMPPPPTATSVSTGGSQRTNSWTDQTEYPKEKAKPYLRPWMVKKPPVAPPAPTPLSQVWAEPGLPDPDEYPARQRLRRPRAPLPPPVDKDGRQYGDADYNLPSPPERDSNYREKWREPVTEETLAKLAEMEEGGTPFLDQLRKDSLALYWTDRSGYKDDRDSDKMSHSRDGRESVATVVTNSSSNSSNDTLKCHGSLGDLSNYGPLTNVNHSQSSSTGSPTHLKYDVVHSSKVPPVERHNSECVLYYGHNNGSSTSAKKQLEKSPNIDTTKPPTVAERIHELERQSRSVPDLLKSAGLSNELRLRPVAPAASTSSSTPMSPTSPQPVSATIVRTPSKSSQHLKDAEKNRQDLKAIQKQAVMEFFERQTGKTRPPGYGPVTRGAAISGTLPRSRPNGVKAVQSLDGDPCVVDPHGRLENGTNGVDKHAPDALSPLKQRANTVHIVDAEPVPERPPKKQPSPTEDCTRRIEEAAMELKNLSRVSSSPGGRKPRAPDPPSSQVGLRCSSPELPPPPPPPPLVDDYEPPETPDDPFPPPPSPRQVQKMTGTSGSAPKPISSSSFKQTTYHKDSYMVHRKDRKFGTNIEERYRRHISPASHSIPHSSSSTSAIPAMVAASGSATLTTPSSCRQQLQQLANGSNGSLLRPDSKPPKPFVSPNTWERNHNVRQPSTTVVFTSAELQAIRDKEKAAAFKSTPDLHPSASSPSLRYGTASSTGSASVTSSSSGGSFKSSYRSPFETNNNRKMTSGASTTSTVSLDLLMDDASDGDASSQSPVSSLSVSPCHSRGDSQDSVTSSSPPGSKPTTLRPKRREEIECEELSKDLAKQLPKNDFLSSLLDPGPEHKSPVDYVGNLFDFQEDDNRKRSADNSISEAQSLKERAAKFCCSAPDLSENGHNRSNDGIVTGGGGPAPLPATSPYFTTSECKAKLLTRYSSDLLSKPIIHTSKELAEKKDELLERISKKLSVLRAERAAVEEETAMNEALGKAVSERIEAALDAVCNGSDEEAAVMTRKDREKFRTHVQEIDKITSLLLGLSGRLARAENALANLPEDASDQDRKMLEGKRDRLVEQLEEAKQLKETIDRRSHRVSEFLARHLTQDELSDYDHFVRMKAKLIVQAREIDEKIKLGEEQTVALRDALVTSPTKS